jgi:ubiquinone/menaquinone biosynthesis C-methylase UbiE
MRAIAIRIPAAKRILDFGCGTGWFLAEAQVDGNPFRVGVDYSRQSLDGTNGVPRLQSGERNPVRLVLADGLHLPFADESFDVVIGHVSMPYMDTRKAMLQVQRVLVPGGSFFLTFHSFHYLRQRVLKSLKSGNWRDVAYMLYVGTNGLLNHFNLQQRQVWWKPRLFETVNTRRGVYLAATEAGFVRISPESRTKRIFFAVAGQKPSGGRDVTPLPEAVYPQPTSDGPSDSGNRG